VYTGGVVVGGVLAVPVVVALVVPVAAVAVSTYAGYLLTRRIKRVVRRASRSSWSLRRQVADRQLSNEYAAEIDQISAAAFFYRQLMVQSDF